MALARLFNTIILFFLFSILVAQDPPANDDPSGAIEITVHSASSCPSDQETTGTYTDATFSSSVSFPDKSEKCISDGGADPLEPVDVWYKATVPSSGSFSVKVESLGDGETGTSLIAYTYDSTSTTYTKIKCDGDGSSAKQFDFSDRTAGEVIYFRVIPNSSTFVYDAGLPSSLTICAWDSSSLDIETSNPTSLLSYYSNPVGNHLVVESPYEIQSLSVYDLRGKAVLHKTPNQQNLRLQTYMLAAGAYVLRVETPAGQQNVQLIKK